MIKKILILLVCLVAVTACSKEKKVSIPPEVIPPDQMVQVLVDFHLAEASLVQASLDQKNVDSLNNLYFYQILQKHQINYKKYNESLKFYSSNLEELHKIYGDVVSELSKTQTRIVSRNF
ncbi:MAG TPA: DUF4296 domain-containing protein [Bacteroidales bacterium]|nr:DUF4296 domain-containing protein [Bacteroidales bacterium]